MLEYELKVSCILCATMFRNFHFHQEGQIGFEKQLVFYKNHVFLEPFSHIYTAAKS